MQTHTVTYQAKPEASERNTQLIQDVFRELAAAAPNTVRYAVLRAEDGTFIHLVAHESDDHGALTNLPAFKAFQAGGAACRATDPVFSDVTVVGNYRMLPD